MDDLVTMTGIQAMICFSDGLEGLCYYKTTKQSRAADPLPLGATRETNWVEHNSSIIVHIGRSSLSLPLRSITRRQSALIRSKDMHIRVWQTSARHKYATRSYSERTRALD